LGPAAARLRLAVLAAGVGGLFVVVALTGSISPGRVRAAIDPLGAVLAFAIARFVARDSVDALAGRRLRGVQAWIERRGFWAVLYGRIAPAVPYSLLNYVAGLTRVRLAAFTAATAIGVAPRAFAYTALGGSLHDLAAPEAIVAVVLLAVMALAGAVALRREGGPTAAGSETARSSPESRSAARP
jgi:hypothetical protein